MPNYYYTQQVGGEKVWKPLPASAYAKFVADNKPEFVSVLAVSKIVEGLEADERGKLSYSGPMYFDFDGMDIDAVLPKVIQFIQKLEALGLNLSMVKFFATGGKGFHIEIPQACFMQKVPPKGVPNLPLIYKEVALELCVDTLDLRVYSQGRGRMWRVPNNLRANGHYKVPVSAEEICSMDAALYQVITASPRAELVMTAPELCVDLAITYDKAAQKVEDRMKARGKHKKDPQAKAKAAMPSVMAMMDGQGIRPDAGFHQIALQVAVAANTAGMDEKKMLEACEGLITSHQSDSNRYNSPDKRRVELARMFAYCDDNPCYEFSVGAIKSLLIHPAPDLDGLHVTKEEVIEGIAEAKEERSSKAGVEGEDNPPDEFEDTSGGITLTKFGVYVNTEEGKKRICAVSFCDIHLLMSTENGQLIAYEAEVLVNGRRTGRQTMEIDTFSSVQIFNRFCARLGHAMQGIEVHIRGLMMRFVELAKKKGRMRYIAKREGLDVINIPNHDEHELRKPFMVWGDGRGVMLDPRVADTNVDMSFQGYPDPRGLFKADLADAPKLNDWLTEEGNKELLQETLKDMFSCQKEEVIGKMIGWYVASIYRMLFHRAYNQFPVLEINGAAGCGKTSMSRAFMSLFYYNQEPKMLTPGSTLFAVTQHMAGSASIPLLLDEYKPHEMGFDLHSRYKLMIRDAYNCRGIAKGGGTRETDDYRSLHETQLAAPLVVIAEAAEEEAAVSERVVLVTMVKPPSSVSTSWALRFHNWERNGHVLTSLGQYLVAQAINTCSVEKLQEEFDPLYKEARQKYLLTMDDLKKDMNSDEMKLKQNAKERSVYNFTVARFGLLKFKALVDSLFGPQMFKAQFEAMQNGIYSRMGDLQSSTQAEWAKVLNMMSTMSHHVDPESPIGLRKGKDYAFSELGGLECIEISLRNVYMKYRSYCRQSSIKPLYMGEQSFLHAMKDCPALINVGIGSELKGVPGVYTLDINKLSTMNVETFKA